MRVRNPDPRSRDGRQGRRGGEPGQEFRDRFRELPAAGIAFVRVVEWFGERGGCGLRGGSGVATAVGGGNGGEGEVGRMPIRVRIVLRSTAFELSAEVIVAWNFSIIVSIIHLIRRLDRRVR